MYEEVAVLCTDRSIRFFMQLLYLYHDCPLEFCQLPCGDDISQYSIT